MIGVQNCQFLAKSENLTNACAYSNKLIVKNEYFGIFTQFGLFSYYSYNKNCTIPYFINLISDRANFTVSGPTSLYYFRENRQDVAYVACFSYVIDTMLQTNFEWLYYSKLRQVNYFLNVALYNFFYSFNDCLGL